jgi:glycosyltransferase involved in cell wall biosynthesis
VRPIRVLCLVTLPTLGAGNRLRFEQYGPLLRAEGIELVVSPFFDAAAYRVLYRGGQLPRKVMGVLKGTLRRLADVWRARSHDLVVVYRESAPIGPPLFERMLGIWGVPFVFDFDDAIFLGPIHPVNRRWSWLRHPSRVAETTRRARSVIVSNEYLASWARKYNRDVTIIPTAVDPDRHRPLERPAHDRIVLVWTGSGTTSPYLHLLDGPLTTLARKRDDLVLRVIGGEYEHPEVPVWQLRYDLEGEPADVAMADIGVLPQPDDEWTRAKGAFKALVYMAAGLPVVASDVGINKEVIVDGETGYCVSDDAGWVRAIERLAGDRTLRARLGAAGRRRVEERYSIRVHGPRLAAALRAAVRASGSRA